MKITTTMHCDHQLQEATLDSAGQPSKDLYLDTSTCKAYIEPRSPLTPFPIPSSAIYALAQIHSKMVPYAESSTFGQQVGIQ